MITDGEGLGTINDDEDPEPTLSINDVTQLEGDSGSANATFTVTLSAASGQSVTVSYGTVEGTATAPGDYTATSGLLTFAPGDTSETVDVALIGDARDEINEDFTVALSSPANATLGDDLGLGTITDDDPLPSLSVGDVTITEGNSGTANATFTVTLTPVSGRAVSVNYATENNSASAGSDYVAASGPLGFAAGQTSQTVSVPVNADLLDEQDEAFFLDLSGATNATITDHRGVGTITDDDPLPSLSVGDVTVSEGNSGTANATFTVTLSPASGRAVSVNYATANNSASAGSDYVAASGPLSFAAGETTKTVTVSVNGDVVDEENESFFLNLATPTAATIGDNQGLGTITDDDATPEISIGSASVSEGNAGSVDATFTVSLSGASDQTVTVDYATANGTATAPADYTAENAQLSFLPGQTSKTVTVAVNGDTVRRGPRDVHGRPLECDERDDLRGKWHRNDHRRRPGARALGQ